MYYSISAACGCSTGKKRKNNEDHFCFVGVVADQAHEKGEQLLTWRGTTQESADFGVFDGMGGHENGEKAAHLAAMTLSKASKCKGKPDELEALNKLAIQMSNKVYIHSRREKTNMGSTAAILRLLGDRFYLCNVGDSRIYRLRNGTLEQQSVDHTEEAILRAMGIEQIGKLGLTQYLGVDPQDFLIEPHLKTEPLEAGDQFLICSDGVTDMLSEKELSEILNGDHSCEKKAAQVISQANERGGKDNITVILVQVHSREQ